MLEFIKSIYWKILEWLHRRSIIVTPGDYLYIRDEIEFSQYIICSRIIDIENYSLNHIPSFRYSNALSKSQNIESFDAAACDKRFENLLKSVKENGFQTKRRIAFNQQFNVNDGTHRAAIAFTLGIKSLPSYYYPVPSHWGTKELKVLKTDNQYVPFRIDIEKRLLIINKELREKGIACCVFVINVNEEVVELLLNLISKYAKDVIIEKIDVQKYNRMASNEKGYLSGYPVDIDNGILIHFLPKKYDYKIRNRRLVLQSMKELELLIKRVHPQAIFYDNFVDGEKLISAIKPYLA